MSYYDSAFKDNQYFTSCSSTDTWTILAPHLRILCSSKSSLHITVQTRILFSSVTTIFPFHPIFFHSFHPLELLEDFWAFQHSYLLIAYSVHKTARSCCCTSAITAFKPVLYVSYFFLTKKKKIISNLGYESSISHQWIHYYYETRRDL